MVLTQPKQQVYKLDTSTPSMTSMRTQKIFCTQWFPSSTTENFLHTSLYVSENFAMKTQVLMSPLE